jgi:hypothetical protein
MVDATRPADHWNDVEIRCEGRMILFFLNGLKVNEVQANRAIVCHPGFQVDGADIRIRDIRIQQHAQPKNAAQNVVLDALAPETVWTGKARLVFPSGARRVFPVTFTVLERVGDNVKARWEAPSQHDTWEIRASIKNGRIRWSTQDVTVIGRSRGEGHDAEGAIEDEQITLSYSGIAENKNEYSATITLDLKIDQQ